MADSAKSITLDVLYVRRFITLLLKDFENWDAARLGIIDDMGNIIKKRADRRSSEEKKAFTRFHKVVLTIKKTLNKISSNKTLTVVAAISLLKEHCNDEDIDFSIMESQFMIYLKEEYNVDYEQLIEDVPTVNTSAVITPATKNTVNINTFRRTSSKKKKKKKKDMI